MLGMQSKDSVKWWWWKRCLVFIFHVFHERRPAPTICITSDGCDSAQLRDAGAVVL